VSCRVCRVCRVMPCVLCAMQGNAWRTRTERW
jgi:hypothetical protein